ncbi:MAG TPA: HEAT repeat domain-containing protein [Thermoanaerobaculia bacterium]|nr:HEAT repeat domain-containing protein [Thermoanaerobaculia bacterium]
MMNGVAYQLLWSLLRVWKATVRDVLEGPTLLQPRGVTLILEPPEGGDLEMPGAVEQIKARSTGRPWSLEEVIRDVLPDLYKACRSRTTPTRYRFVTEGSMGAWEDVYHSFRSLPARRVDAGDPLAALDDQQEFASATKNRALARKIKEAGGRYTERGILLYIARVLAGEESTGKGERKVRRPVQDSPDVLHRNLLRLLANFEFEGDRQWPVIEDEVARELSARGVKDHALEQKLDSLVGGFLRRAREGGAVVDRAKFLAQHGLQAIPLLAWDLIARESQFSLVRSLALHGYKASEDCRERKPLLNLLQAAGGEPIVAWGESGQGKSWLLYGTAEELARRNEVVLLLDSSQDVLRDRDEAARLFCERIWGTDERYSLDRLAQKVRQEVPEHSGGIWLTVLIDGVKDRNYLATLVQQEWDAIGVRVAVALTTDTNAPERVDEGVLPLSVRDFSQREVLRYLRLQLGTDTLLPPQDILRLLRHPLWARLFCELVSGGGQWQSNNEYQLIEGYWTGQAAHAPIATDALTELASQLIDGGDYPWPLSRLRAIGIDEVAMERLLLTRLVRWGRSGRVLELWHERLLQWAISEGLVAGLRAGRLTSQSLRDRLRACIEGAGGRRFGYVAMDVLWLLSGPESPRDQDILGLLQLFEEIDGFFDLISTLGNRIVPHLFVRLRQIAGESSYSEIRYLEMLESMSDPSIAGFAVDMLNDSSICLQKAAARVLAAHGSTEALDRLWALYREWSRNVKAQREEGLAEESEVDFHDVVQTDKALQTCVRLAPNWLEQAISNADPATDPVHTLIFLIPRVVQGQEVWHRVKRVAFEKVRPERERCLAVCITHFHDCEEVPWLEERVNGRGDSLAPMARKGLYLLSPEGALRPIDPDVEFDLALARSWWLPPLQLEFPQETAKLLLDTIRAAERPWIAACLYDGRENWLSEETLELLLDTTNELLVRELEEPSPSNHEPLGRPFDRLSEISHPDLLKLFWRRRGTELERNLAAWLIREGPWEEMWKRHALDVGLAVLHKIAGDGIFEVANSYLERATTYWGRDEAFELALRASDKRTIEFLTQIAFQEQEHLAGAETHLLDQREALQVLAERGYDKTVIRGVVRWGLRLPPDFAEYLGGRALGDVELTSALEDLSLDPMPPGAILALGMSGRPEMEETILSLFNRVEPASKQALASLLALEMLDARSEVSEQAFLRAREIQDHRFVARRVLNRFEARRATNESRAQVARHVWEQRDDLWALFEENESLETLAHLDNEEVREYLRERALSESAWGGQPSAHYDAVRALTQLAPSRTGSHEGRKGIHQPGTRRQRPCSDLFDRRSSRPDLKPASPSAMAERF